MKWTVLLFFVLATALTGCSNDKKTENVFQPLPPTPEYIVVVKKQTPNVVLGHRIIQNEEMDPIVQQINESHPSVAFKSCPASVNFFDVLLHYANGSTDRTLKVLLCPGTVDQLSGVVMEPGVLFSKLDQLFEP